MNWKTAKIMHEMSLQLSSLKLNQVDDMYIKIYPDGIMELVVKDKEEQETCLHMVQN